MQGSDALLNNYPRDTPRARLFRPRLESVSVGLDVLESRVERSATGAAPDAAAVVDVAFNFLSPKSNQSAESQQKKKLPQHHLRTRSLFRFCANDIYFCDMIKI